MKFTGLCVTGTRFRLHVVTEDLNTTNKTNNV